MYNVRTIHDFLIGDFVDLWNLVASCEGEIHRGNYTFALKSMIYLEFISTVCAKDADRLIGLAKKVDQRYFTELPISRKLSDAFDLPYLDSDECIRNRYLLTWLFAMIRHGTAHGYDQVQLDLGEFDFGIGITGPKDGGTIELLQDDSTDTKHLQYIIKNTDRKSIEIRFNPARFLLDFKKAIEESRLVEGLGSQSIKKESKYSCKLDTMERALRDGGLKQYE